MSCWFRRCWYVSFRALELVAARNQWTNAELPLEAFRAMVAEANEAHDS